MTGTKEIDVEMIQPFRNHTRYVRLDVALECREYVEKNLILLDSYISKDNEV